MVIEKYKITAENTYDFDKRGFLIGFRCTLKRVRSGRIMKAKQDGAGSLSVS
jgi:hypothetical protein